MALKNMTYSLYSKIALWLVLTLQPFPTRL